jgi:hypothetical protein
MSITVGSRTSLSRNVARWEITASANGGEVKTRYDFLRWDDIIRQHWTRNEGALLVKTLSTFWLFLQTGLLLKAWKAAWKPTALFIYPTVLLMFAISAGVAASLASGNFLDHSGHSPWLAAFGALAAFLAILLAGRIISSKTSAYWILRLCNFCGTYGQGKSPDMEQRLDEFARIAAEEIGKGEADEYLFVGHSVGAILAIPVLARLIRNHEIPSARNIALLTLGQCIPLVSFLPHASRYRHELNEVANAGRITWIDYSSPADPVCFALVDPIASCGLPVPDAGRQRPKLLNARFYKLIAEDRYQEIRRDGKRLHFQYLMAGDIFGEYDFFAITAGGLSLKERFVSVPHLTSQG